ncbi:MAG: hypothetical protein LBO09_09170 [Candidatus Peribacteria bacterium]|jgi:hypothetical protein|nr:hypothetical protein [Candidatus Peribacteria bacterium]
MKKTSYCIEIAKSACNRMKRFVEQAENRILWFGLVKRKEDTFLITKVFLEYQEDTPSGVKLKSKEFLRFLRTLPDGDGNKIHFLGISQGRDEIIPTPVDNQLLKVLGERSEYHIRCITNKVGEIKFSLYIDGKIIDNIPWSIKKNKGE